ncbi:DUF6270 domain-containing protein [Aeromonas popoffii]|uniref:DUF6270 domain-containing protein n=1 Tax=Aeromonas popoffii TaxID=70856 RepID=UPI0030CD5325
MQSLFAMASQKSFIAFKEFALKKAAIIGSCVTRDAFEFDNSILDISGSYFPRISIISMMSAPIPIDHTILSSENQWLKWVILNDYNKTSISQIKNKNPDYILIDLIEERHDIIKVGDSYLTLSDDFIKINPFAKKEEYSHVVGRESDDVVKLFYEKSASFCERINSDFPNTTVIIHDAKYSDYYMDKGKIKRFDEIRCHKNKVMNSRLDCYVSFLMNRISNVKKISIDKEISLASSGHKWGLSPFHYIDEYYLEFINKVRKIIS